jgi:hypothetical protein
MHTINLPAWKALVKGLSTDDLLAFKNVYESSDHLPDDLKAAGIKIQSLIFPRSKWESAEAVRSWLSSHGYSTDLDSTENSWRARQEDPGRFQRLRSFCINPSRDASASDCRVMATGGPLKESRSMESEDPIIEPSEAEEKDAAASQDDRPPEVIEDWQAYPEDRRPPIPVLIKWLRLYRYHMPFLHDIRKRDKKEISPDTVSEFKTLVEELIDVASQLNIKILKSRLLPTLEEEELMRQQYDARAREISARVNAEQELAYQQLQAKAEDLARQSHARSMHLKRLTEE